MRNELDRSSGKRRNVTWNSEEEQYSTYYKYVEGRLTGLAIPFNGYTIL